MNNNNFWNENENQERQMSSPPHVRIVLPIWKKNLLRICHLQVIDCLSKNTIKRQFENVKENLKTVESVTVGNFTENSYHVQGATCIFDE